MSIDVRFSGVLHLLLHMADADAPITSEELARALRSNAVVARRIMAGLRETGIVRATKGHGGGWTLAREPAEVTLRMIYDALGAPRLVALGNRNESPECLLEQAVNLELDEARRQAEDLLLARMERVTLASLSDNFKTRLAALGLNETGNHHA